MLSEPLTTFFSDEEINAMALLRRSMGVDITRTFQFWEALVARITSGSTTDHKCAWDVEIADVHVEVKSSTEFQCKFGTGSRPVFKFALPKGGAKEKSADVLVLIGMDGLGDINSWVIPANRVRHCKSITITSPRHRTGHGKGFDDYYCPPSQMLPEILRSWRCHPRYVIKHHAETARATRRGRKAIGDLFDMPGA